MTHKNTAEPKETPENSTLLRTFWRPQLPYGYSYKTSYARPG